MVQKHSLDWTTEQFWEDYSVLDKCFVLYSLVITVEDRVPAAFKY